MLAKLLLLTNLGIKKSCLLTMRNVTRTTMCVAHVYTKPVRRVATADYAFDFHCGFII